MFKIIEPDAKQLEGPGWNISSFCIRSWFQICIMCTWIFLVSESWTTSIGVVYFAQQASISKLWRKKVDFHLKAQSNLFNYFLHSSQSVTIEEESNIIWNYLPTKILYWWSLDHFLDPFSTPEMSILEMLTTQIYFGKEHPKIKKMFGMFSELAGL